MFSGTEKQHENEFATLSKHNTYLSLMRGEPRGKQEPAPGKLPIMPGTTGIPSIKFMDGNGFFILKISNKGRYGSFSNFLARSLSGFFCTVCRNLIKPTDWLKMLCCSQNIQPPIITYLAKSWKGCLSTVPASPVDNPKISSSWQLTGQEQRSKHISAWNGESSCMIITITDNEKKCQSDRYRHPLHIDDRKDGRKRRSGRDHEKAGFSMTIFK